MNDLREKDKKSQPLVSNMDRDRALILDYLRGERNIDFAGYSPAFIELRLAERTAATGCRDHQGYLDYLKNHPDEIDRFIGSLTINISSFFRDTLTFDYLADRVLPSIVLEKKKSKSPYFRIWSAGCATGEEPYSIAILVDELFRKEELHLDLHLFASDTDKKSLKIARGGIYPFESVENVKYRILKKYFIQNGEQFRLIPKIKNLVVFTDYNLIEKKHYVPLESVFGGFDLVLCRNVLIYFTTEFQDFIFAKLYRSLVQGGYLVLGEAERPTLKYQRRFQRVNDICHIYKKLENY